MMFIAWKISARRRIPPPSSSRTAELGNENQKPTPELACTPHLVEAGSSEPKRQSQQAGLFKLLSSHYRLSAGTQKSDKDLEIDETYPPKRIAAEGKKESNDEYCEDENQQSMNLGEDESGKERG